MGMVAVLWAVKVFHIIGMAMWFGVPLTIASDMRRTFDAAANGAGLAARAEKVAKLATMAGVLTFVTGLGMIFLSGGFGSVPVRIHIGLTLTIVMILMGVFGFRPAVAGLSERLKADDFAGAAPFRKRIGMLGGISHLLWLIVLILMVVKA